MLFHVFCIVLFHVFICTACGQLIYCIIICLVGIGAHTTHFARRTLPIELFFGFVFERTNVLHGQAMPLVQPAKHLTVIMVERRKSMFLSLWQWATMWVRGVERNSLTDGTWWRAFVRFYEWNSLFYSADQTIWTRMLPVCSMSSQVWHYYASQRQPMDLDRFSPIWICGSEANWLWQ